MSIQREHAELAWHVARAAVLTGCIASALYTAFAARAEVQRLSDVVDAQAADAASVDDRHAETLAEIESLHSELALVRDQQIAIQESVAWTVQVAADSTRRHRLRAP